MLKMAEKCGIYLEFVALHRTRSEAVLVAWRKTLGGVPLAGSSGLSAVAPFSTLPSI